VFKQIKKLRTDKNALFSYFKSNMICGYKSIPSHYMLPTLQSYSRSVLTLAPNSVVLVTMLVDASSLAVSHIGVGQGWCAAGGQEIDSQNFSDP
jgi:hypothetical protein